MGRIASRGCPAFSFVEIVLALMILSMLVSITVTTFTESMDQTQRQVTTQKLQYLADAVQRWKMEQNREYPYRTLRPLEEKYIKHLEADPWGSEYAVDPGRGFVYSYGPNRRDNGGQGDDMRYSFDTDRDPPPGAPSELQAERLGANVQLTWRKPLANIDGSPATDLAPYALYMRRSQDPEYLSTSPAVIASSVQVISFTTASIGCVNETVYFVLRAVDRAGHQGPPSNPAGIFVVARTSPVVNVLKPSKGQCHIGETFTLAIDVSDGDANLSQLTLTMAGSGVGPIVWTPAPPVPPNLLKLDNTFHPVILWSHVPLAPSPPFTVVLTALDLDGNTRTKTLTQPCQFVNTAPKVSTLSPGVFTMTVLPASTWASPPPSGPFELTYLMEAVDEESNLWQLCVSATYDPGGEPDPSPAKSASWNYAVPGVPIAVEQTSGWKFLPKKEQTVTVAAYAKDTLGLVSPPKFATLKLYRDQTPPSYLTAALDSSNPCLTTEPFDRWWINTPTKIEGDLFAWENESPPVTYRMIISTCPPTPSDVNFKAQAVTRTTSAPRWSEFKATGSGLKHFRLTHNVAEEGQQLQLPGGKWNSDYPYYMTVRASNSVGQWTPTSTLPRHKVFKTLQSSFGFDDVPPEITQITLDSLGPVLGTSDVWVADVLSATWSTRDLRHPPNPTLLGSGPKRWQYRILCDPDYKSSVGDTYYLANWVETDTPEIRSLVLPKTYGVAPVVATPDAKFILFLKARDCAGNWSPITTAGARMDLTTPLATSVLPRISNTGADGFLHTADTVECRWPGVFVDPESGIESYEWGVATTANPIMGMPDVVPWQQTLGTQTFSAFSQDNLLVDGSTVYLLVRARNFAKGVSGLVHSTGVGVDVTVYTEVKASPRQGYSPLSVKFTAAVTGGTGPFTYSFFFDGTDTYPNRCWSETVAASTFTTWFTYLESSFGPGRHSALVKIKDAFGVTSSKDIHLDLFASPMVAVLMSSAGSNDFALYRFNGSTLAQAFTYNFGDANMTAVAFDVCRAGNFLYILSMDTLNGHALTRWDYRGAHSGATSFWTDHQAGTWAEATYPTDLKLAADGSYLFCSGTGQGGNGPGWLGWWGRCPTDPVGGAIVPTAVTGQRAAGTAPCYAAVTWGGGRESAVIQDGGVGGANNRRVVGVDQGFGDQVPELARYFAPAVDTDMTGLRAMAVSPDGAWLAMTYNANPAPVPNLGRTAAPPEAVLCDPRLLVTGVGAEQPVTFVQCIMGDISLTNPVWRYDSRYFYAAAASAGNQLFYCDASVAVPTLNLVAQVGGPLGGNLKCLDLTEDGRYLVAVSASQVYIGQFTTPTNVTWTGSTVLPVATGLRVRFMDRPAYGAPIVNQVLNAGPSLPAGTLNMDLRGANLGPNTVAYRAENPVGVLVWSTPGTQLITSAATYDQIHLQLTAPGLAGPPPKVVRVFLRNSVGAATFTTSYDVNFTL